MTVEYIKRNDAIELIKEQIDEHPVEDMDIGWNAGLSCAIGQLESMPVADVVKRIRGKWIMKEVITGEFGRLIVCQCSKCKKNQTFQTKCCSNCGAEMEFDKGWYERCMMN